MSTVQQRKVIHILKNRIGMSDEDYRDILEANYGVRSSLDLTDLEAEELIRFFRTMISGKQVYSSTGYKKRYNELTGRPARYATPKQLRMIEAMWAEVSYIEDPVRRRIALDKFCRRIVGEYRLEDVKKWQVQKLVKAIENMKKPERVGN